MRNNEDKIKQLKIEVFDLAEKLQFLTDNCKEIQQWINTRVLEIRKLNSIQSKLVKKG